MKYLFLFLLTITQLSCISKQKKSKKEIKSDFTVKTININKTKEIVVDVNDLVEEIKYIPLSINKTNSLNKFQILRHNKDYFFAKPMSQDKIVVFDTKWHHIFDIDNSGEGPLEFFRIIDFTVDDNYIYLIEMGNFKIMKYDIEKKLFVKETKLNETSARSINLYKNNFFLVTTDRKDGFIKISEDDNFKKLKSFVKSPNTFNLIVSLKPFVQYKDTLLISVGFTDTVYYSTGEHIKPYIAFDNSFGTLSNNDLQDYNSAFFSRELTKNQKNITIPLGNIMSLANIIFINIYKPLGTLIWNKNTGNINFLPDGNFNDYSLVSNSFFSFLDHDDEGYTYSSILLNDDFYQTAKKTMTTSNNIVLKSALSKLLNQYPEGSGFENPVIVKWKIKTEVFDK